MFTFQLPLQGAQLLQQPISNRGKFRTRLQEFDDAEKRRMYLLHIIAFVFGFSEVNFIKS